MLTADVEILQYKVRLPTIRVRMNKTIEKENDESVNIKFKNDFALDVTSIYIS